MNRHIHIGLGFAASGLVLGVMVGLFVWEEFCPIPAAAEGAEPKLKPKADNGMCYVCHLTLATEEITTSHLAEGHGCLRTLSRVVSRPGRRVLTR